MIELHEYARLLGYPAGKMLEGDVLTRARESIDWYARYGRPTVFIRGSVVALTAGSELEREVQKRWREDRVDEAYFLDRLGAAVVEQLGREHPHDSPGYGSWDLEAQVRLVAALGPEAPVSVLPTGMLEPVNSLVGVLTGRAEASSCPDCDYRCAFRRVS